MAEERLFGNSIDEAVVKEIEKREKLLLKANAQGGNLLPDSTENLKSLRYTTQRGAWVRMISSVNTDFKEETVENSVVPTTLRTSDNTLAKNFILTGGEITSAGTKREGISFEADRNTTKSYRKTATVGVRPEAGITSFSIKHKGTYGSLREAEISFNVWSKEDLNRAQDIYLRPGVHMIVEWGHTLDSDVKLTNIPNADVYFKKSTRETIQELINKHREANLSYEGFIGLVTNFSWSLREDGGYDCSVRIISTGAVMESLTTIQGASHLSTDEANKCMGLENEDEIEDSQKSLMHNFVLGVARDKKIFKGKLEGGPTFDRTVNSSQRFSQAVQDILTKENISLYGFSTKAKQLINTLVSDFDNFRYITIRDLLKFLNASEFFPKAPNGETPAKFYIEPEPAPPLLVKSTYPKFKTFPEHFSLDIKTCFLPKPPISDNEVDQEFLTNITLKQGIETIFLNSSFAAETNNIQSILVELDFILETFDAALSSEEDNILKLNVFSFMQNLLKGINNALGNITDLDLHFKDEESGYIIVDREAVTTTEAMKKVAALSFTGLSNTVQKVSIQTKITPQLSSQIAISAQGTKGLKQGDNNSNLSMIQWNAGIEDRFNPKDNGPADKQSRTSNCTGQTGQPSSTDDAAELRNIISTLNLPTDFTAREIQNRSLNGTLVDLNGNRIRRTGGFGTAINRLAAREQARVQEQRAKEQEQRAKEAGAAQAQFNIENPFVESFLKPWSEAFLELTEGSKKGWFGVLGKSTSYRAELFSKLRRFGIAYFRERYFNSIGGADNEDKTSDPGLIPIELSITLDGIGGLKIGQVFKLDQVDKFLPDVYKDYGFIITAIDSAIENNKWNTTIKALTFKIPTTPTALSQGSTASSNTRSTAPAGVPATSATLYIQAVAWSAGFISYVVKGAVANFPSQGNHTGYAQSIRINKPTGWQVLDPAVQKPRPGDIVVRNRGGAQALKFSNVVWQGNSHGDIVVSANDDAITFIGGNLSDTTVKQVVRRGGQPVKGGKLPTTGPDLYFVILRPPQTAAATIVSRAEAEYRKWNAGGWKETTPAAYSTIYSYYVAGNIDKLAGVRGTPLRPPIA